MINPLYLSMCTQEKLNAFRKLGNHKASPSLNEADRQYKEILQRVMREGFLKHNRTGIDTIGLFNAHMSVNLKNGFPLLTHKKVHFKSIVHELLWFIKGDSNIKYMKDNGVSIWNEWADESGDVGPLYPKMWRRLEAKAGNFVWVKSKKKDPSIVERLGITKNDVSNPYTHKMWKKLISKCYNSKDEDYKQFGGRGVYVCERWLNFENFLLDLPQVLYYYQWLNSGSGEDYELDVTYYDSNYFSKDTCVFATKDQIEAWGSIKIEAGDYVYRPQIVIDQLHECIEKLRSDAYDRRILMSCWIPEYLPAMSLSPCHPFVFFGSEPTTPRPTLHLKFSMRSSDLVLGAPFNLASYALLLHMVAQVTNHEVGTLGFDMWDCHIYVNHLDGIEKILDNPTYQLPKLKINPEINDINDFKYEDIELIDYKHSGTMKFPVAV